MQPHKNTIRDQSTLMGFNKAVNVAESKRFRFMLGDEVAIQGSETNVRSKTVNIRVANDEKTELIRQL